ncbi:MAG: hypothetical protein JXA18_04355 [Chitinispirillaceae bacterium]|nr:hypothetical protein [Chitinispirillaceae bacterium]
MAIQKSGGKKLSSYGRLGVLLAAIGTVLAIDTMADLSFLYKLWPLLCAILGIGFIGIYLQRSRRESAYIGVGSFIIGFSGLALYCNFTSWGILASLWPAFILLLGIAMISGFIFGNRRPAILLTGLLFISLGAVFFMVFSFNRHLWWSIFILAGFSFLIFDRVRRS